MKGCLFLHLFIAAACIVCPPTGKAQSLAKKGLFASEEPFDITLKGKVRDVLKDRSDKSPYRPLLLSFRNEDSSEITIPVEVKTRGHFRKQSGNCNYPPLQIKFPEKESQLSSVFKEQSKLKLVMPCTGDEYTIREWLVYRLYNLITEKSFRARLVRVKLEDEKSKKPSSPFYGILLEEEKQMAKRNKAVSVERKIRPEQTETDAFLIMAVFQYLIGNTDWSIQYMQNIKFLATDSNAVPTAVPYDFDHAGLVNAPYAKPAEELLMSSVRQRRYRGYCASDIKIFDPVVAQYNRLKNDIYAVFTGCPLLDAKYINNTVKYLDEFYATINNPESLKKEFLYPCDKNGTGNVVIKGLRED